MATLSRAALFALAPLFSFAVACTSTNPTPAPDASSQVCPTTIIQATASTPVDGLSSACAVDNQVCFVGFQCGNFTQQANCTCDLNKWSCVLSNGDVVPADVTDPTTLCQSTGGDAGEACPASVSAGAGTKCTNAGQQCAYAGISCPNSKVKTATDLLYCTGAADDAGNPVLQWLAEPGTCGP